MGFMVITNNIQAVLQQIATQTAESVQAQICTIFFSTIDKSNENFVIGGHNVSSVNQYGFLEFSHKLASNGKPFYWNSLEPVPREFESVFRILQSHAIKAVVGFPIIVRGASCGSLALFFTSPRGFSTNEILQLSTLVNTAVVALDLNDDEKTAQHGNDGSLANIMANSTAMSRVLEVMKKAATTDANVLIFGESGTGKELIARGIHHLSRRHNNAFIPVDCVALPSHLLESELFGFEKGAFTGAFDKKQGLFDLADQGTFFLDEICELDPMLQAKLLRVLQERQFRRIGGKKLVNVDIRVISATNRYPEAAVREKILREDLYFRLNVIPIHVPALRERKEDIQLLAAHFIGKFAQANGLDLKTPAPETFQLLQNYDWPGNVRELQNTMERVVSLCPHEVILPEDLPACIRQHSPYMEPTAASVLHPEKSWRENLRAFKRTYYKALLEQTHGDIPAAARQAKVSLRTLYRVAHRHKLI